MNPYTALITSQHQKPKFLAMVQAVTDPLVDLQDLLGQIRDSFDLNDGVGVQLDQVGEWVGRSRRLQAPLDDVYFSWNTPGVGWNEGVWRGPFDPLTGLVSLPDDAYRLLLKAKVMANNWDGTRDSAYDVWETLFEGEDMTVFIQDHQDMSITIGIAGQPPSAVVSSLLAKGYIPLKPAGVRVAIYAVPPTGAPGPLFAWNCDNDVLAGWNVGAWPRLIPAGS